MMSIMDYFLLFRCSNSVKMTASSSDWKHQYATYDLNNS